MGMQFSSSVGSNGYRWRTYPLKETMSVLGVPVMNISYFQQTERDIGEWWTKKLEQEMLEAGKEEKRLAQE